MARERGNCITCCSSFIISTVLTCLFLYLTIRTQQPKCYIQSLNTTTSHSHSNNHNISFLIKLTNPNNYKGIRYETVRLAFLDANTTRPLANATLDAFYQGHGKTAHKWGSARVNRTMDGKVFLRVELATRLKYKIFFFYTKRHRLTGGANVEVNATSGEKVVTKGIRLGSEAVQLRGCSFLLLPFFVFLTPTFTNLSIM